MDKKLFMTYMLDWLNISENDKTQILAELERKEELKTQSRDTKKKDDKSANNN